MPNRTLWVGSGIAGVVAVACYILAIALPWPETQLGTSTALMVVSGWPILSIIYSYGLYSFVAAERESTRTASPMYLRSRRSPPPSQ